LCSLTTTASTVDGHTARGASQSTTRTTDRTQAGLAACASPTAATGDDRSSGEGATGCCCAGAGADVGTAATAAAGRTTTTGIATAVEAGAASPTLASNQNLNHLSGNHRQSGGGFATEATGGTSIVGPALGAKNIEGRLSHRRRNSPGLSGSGVREGHRDWRWDGTSMESNIGCGIDRQPKRE
jgi:hypothetical protein